MFAGAPHPYLILTPNLTIVDGNLAYLSATMRQRDQLVGANMFDAFPDNPDDPGATGVANLAASLQRALAWGQRDVMPLQRYDIAGADGVFMERYWSPDNWPIMDDKGSVIALVHHVAAASAPNRGRVARETSSLTMSIIEYAEDIRRTTKDLLARQRELLDRSEALATEKARLIARSYARRKCER